MSLLKPKQIDLEELAVMLAQVIGGNVTYKNLWASILNNTFLTAVFSTAHSNITLGQTVFSINVSTLTPPGVYLVYRNGSKLIETTDYTKNLTTPGVATFVLVDPIAASSGAVFSETIEINYY